MRSAPCRVSRSGGGSPTSNASTFRARSWAETLSSTRFAIKIALPDSGANTVGEVAKTD